MKILHTADWHLGTFRSPVKDGVNLRTEDTKRCLDELIRVANEEKPDYSIVSGDIFHVGRLWSDRCCEEIITAIHYIRELAAVSKQVVVMRGTPNHDGSGQFNVLSEMFADVPNVHVVITPQVISFDDVDISLLGCAGYVCIANTITNPLTGHVLFPNEKDGQELWYMPMFQNQIWTWRRLFQSMGGLGGTATTEKTVEKEHFYMFFDFDKKEEAYGNR